MSRLFMFFIVIVFSTLTLVGCGATLHEAPVQSASVVFDDGPPPTFETARTVRQTRESFAASSQRACDTHRARYGHRPVATRDGTRVYCF